MGLIHFISENITFPLADKVEKIKVKKFFDLLMESQYWDKARLQEFQNRRLQALVKHAYSYVPFYKKVFNEFNLSPSDIQTSEDLVKLPVLNKQLMKDMGMDEFTSEKANFKEVIPYGSSGSTGEPLFYHNTVDAYSLNLAANIRGWYWFGYRLGDKYIKLSQNDRNSFIKKIQDKISRNYYMSTNPLVEENYHKILSKIETYQPKVIRCYPDPLLFLARYRKANPKFKYNPQAIATTGNTLFPETRKEIEDAFGCKIYDSYSCEGNAIVFECDTNSCYHSTEEYGITEVLDEKGNKINKGVGTLVSTDLWNFAHPFIRYDTQDLVEVDDTPCTCGRQLLRINKIIGRDNEILTMPSGQRFIVHNFTGFFQVDHNELNQSVDQFQIIKRKDNSVLFKLKVNSRYNAEIGRFIVGHWEKIMKVAVKIELVDSIPLTKTDKRRFIFNED